MMSSPYSIPLKWLEAASEAIEFAAEKWPLLSRNGWVASAFDKSEPPKPLDVASVATAMAFLRCSGVRILKGFSGRGSYGWKHSAEAWGERIGFAPYVANGDLICAALFLGIPTRQEGPVNCLLALRMPNGVFASWARWPA